ncbi:MAG: hypothetical protein UT55_C0078G0006, partial [Candidatus Peregrinibacteria bacterium GW2011_GWE2_39_6]
MFQFIADQITYHLLNLPTENALGDALNFFIYDTFKILTLIFIVISVVAFIRTFLALSQLKNLLTKSHYGLGNLIAALFGAITPFCSCSSIPLFTGFIKGNIPMGIAFSFLITSPLVNEVAFILMGGLFGWRLAFLYAITGIILGVVAGLFIGSLKMEDQLILDNKEEKLKAKTVPLKLENKINFAVKEGWKTLKKLTPYVIIGVAMGAIIHGYVPQDFFIKSIGEYQILAVPIAVLLGIPIYAGCSTVAPLIFGITSSGIPLGTSLAFMMAIAGLSLPEAIILKRVMSLKLLAVFFLVVAIG